VGRKSHTRALALTMNGERVGTWHAGGGRDELHYAAAWWQSPHARPISLQFPFRPGNAPHTGPLVHHYFDNLLPDAKPIRERLARRFRLESIEAFPLLGAIGRDCVGALQIHPEGEAPPDVRQIAFRKLNEAQVAEVLRRTAGVERESTWARDDGNALRISLAGAQEKTALLWHRQTWCEPLGATPTTHILKLPLGQVGGMQADMSTSVENEWLCARVVEAYGLPVARCEIAHFEDQKALVVERFDRRESRGESGRRWIQRLPQEDFCQATGTPYLNKYQSDGGPGIDDIMRVLGTAERPFDDRRTFFACQVLFWMLAAPDGHAKNFSLRINAGGSFALAPIYDVLSAHPVLGKSRGHIAPQKLKLAMGVRGGANMHYRVFEVRRPHWLTTAQRNGIGREGEAIIDELIARTPGVVARVSAELPRGFPESVAGPILDGLTGAARRLAG
jgi:serine/threonine-protein kinase HipA